VLFEGWAFYPVDTEEGYHNDIMREDFWSMLSGHNFKDNGFIIANPQFK
jgi:hypothetical protein